MWKTVQGRKYWKDYTPGRLYTGKSVQWEDCTGETVHLGDYILGRLYWEDNWEDYWEDYTGKTVQLENCTTKTILVRLY